MNAFYSFISPVYTAISYDLWSQVTSVSVTCIGNFTSYRFDFSQKITKHQSCWVGRERPLDSKTRTTTKTRFSQYQVVRARESASFWRENVIAVVILLQVWFQRDLLSWWRTQVIKCKKFYHSAIGKGLKIESIRKLGNFDFQWTKTLYQNNSSHTALLFTLSRAINIIL